MGLDLELYNLLQKNQNIDNQLQMVAYMKNNFKFFGIKAKERQLILKNFIIANKSQLKTSYREIAIKLYEKPERECHYCAVELMQYFFKKDLRKTDIDLVETLITTNSWWDTVDAISSHLLGEYLLKFPEKTLEVVENFSNADNMWLNRSTLIFQLFYKKNVNEELLFALCEKFSYSKEFFIQKAIGWALRNYAKVNPISVKTFVNNNNLKPLSVREALKYVVY